MTTIFLYHTYGSSHQGPEGSHAAQRAYHPDEVLRSSLMVPSTTTTTTAPSDENKSPSNTPSDDPTNITASTPQQLTLDYEWYLSNQILPPISRLCEPIEGTSAAIISEQLGLDASK